MSERLRPWSGSISPEEAGLHLLCYVARHQIYNKFVLNPSVLAFFFFFTTVGNTYFQLTLRYLFSTCIIKLCVEKIALLGSRHSTSGLQNLIRLYSN